MRRLVPWLMVAAACSSSPATTTVAPEPVTEAIVVLGGQGKLSTIDRDGSTLATIVDGSDRIVLQPTWSPAGERLAWVEVVLAGGPEDVVVVNAAGDGTDAVRVPVANPPFYLDWSPGGDKLALLRNGSVSLVAAVIDYQADDPTEVVLARGQPFYFSWARDSSALLANIGTSERLSFIDLVGNEEPLDVEPGLFQAPAWVDDRIFYVRAEGDAQLLTVAQSDGSDDSVLARADTFIHFLVSPDGTKVAYRQLDLTAPAVTVGLSAQSEIGELVVVDVATGESTVVDPGNPVVFFWSPDSAKLLFLTQAESGFTWNVWDGSAITTFGTFQPSRTFGRDYLPFFDQFAQSVELWSPGSDAFVYAGRERPTDDTQIWLQPLDGPARPIATGVFAAFVPAS